MTLRAVKKALKKQDYKKHILNYWNEFDTIYIEFDDGQQIKLDFDLNII